MAVKPAAVLMIVPLLLLAPALSRAESAGLEFPEPGGRPWTAALSLGVGRLFGDTLYQIGGDFSTAQGRGSVRFPLSELKFPLDVWTATLGASVGFLEDWLVRGSYTANVTSDAGLMEDSDWGYWYLAYGSPFESGSLDIFSESEAVLDADVWQVDLLWRFFHNPRVAVAAGLGYRQERFAYDLSDLHQWYPSSEDYFGYDYSHDYTSGPVGTYEVTYRLPLVEAAVTLTPVDGLLFSGELGVAPLAFAEDRDDHMLRSKLNTGDADGSAVRAAAAARWLFWRGMFVQGGLEYVYVATEGTQTQTWYADTDEADAGTTLTIDQRIRSSQLSLNLTLGWRF